MLALSMLIIVIFLIIYLVIGWYTRKIGKATLDDYLLADRSFSQFVAFFAISATWISVVFYLGGPGWYYSHGLAFLLVPGYAFTFGLMWFLFGRKVNQISREKNYFTQGDFIADFHGQSQPLRLIAMIVGLGALIPYVQSQFISLGYIMHAATDGALPTWAGSTIAFVVVVVYVIQGGMRATAWTNVLQGFMMFIGLFVISGMVLYQFFDFSIANLFAQAQAELPNHLTLPGGLGSMGYAQFGSLLILYGICGSIWFPHLFVRAFAIKDPNFFHRYPKYILGLYILIVPTIMIIGLGGRMIMPGLEQPDQILPQLLLTMAPLPVVTLLLTGAIGASMSTVDGVTHTVASMFTNDFIRRHWDITEKVSVYIVRITIFVIALTGLLLSIFYPAALFALYGLGSSYAGVLAPSCIGPIIKWKKATKWGAMASLILGAIGCLIFQFVYVDPLGIHGGIWGTAIAVVAYILVSLITSDDTKTQRLESAA